MRPYIVTISTSTRRERHVAIANSWYEAWEAAINHYGLRCVISVKPGYR